MRILAAIGVFKELSKDTFAPTKLSSVYVTGSPFREFIVHAYVTCEKASYVLFRLILSTEVLR